MIVTLADAKTHLNIADNADDGLITAQIAAAQDHIERLLGFKIETVYGGEDQDPIPTSLMQAVLLLVGHLYENREATLVGVNAQSLPIGLWDIVNSHRMWWSEPVAG